MEKPLQLGLAGLGTVGTGVYETISRNHAILEARAQIPFAIRKVAVRDLSRPRDVELPPGLLTDNWRDLVDDPEIDIIIELIGGTTEAYRLVKAALQARKPVVTGNKALLAEYGSELFQLSATMGVPLYFEASAGGGIPIIQSMQNSLICNHIKSIIGIINGTSNYILSSMELEGVSFETALARAQQLGFAEADPTFDINGWDAAHKALILTMLAYGTPLTSDKIYVSGIQGVQQVDFEFARKLGYNIKLLVVIRHHDDTDALELRVQPSFIPNDHILASVDGVFNAIAVDGDIVGETLFYGRGAGKNPTASAVIADVITAMRESLHPEHHTGFHPYDKERRVLNINETVTPCYVRFRVADRPGTIAEIASSLAWHKIGISATSSTKGAPDEHGTMWNDLVFILHSCPWGQLQAALAEIAQFADIDPSPAVFRIEKLGTSST
ncbi:homoserine dehydrogenase [Akkermansia glycaniphila]|uniref:Homoserine dehydrogenase n=1 Tax=Akkermansia glycaniphila TaxID=1679444 RepID=A0A1C7PE80_9BACT|nr:homoserine dehydrogenase [Akkermansia glycaniphila]OCA03896.1 homoserine dehydrogenase [Akkermansia glycaniphila]SEH70208.1 homoserine dehydrogenase [Akkermansia glycaniphila]